MLVLNATYEPINVCTVRRAVVLLLKDKLNLSSNNEIYKDKQDTYAKSNLIWNELLVGHMCRFN